MGIVKTKIRIFRRSAPSVLEQHKNTEGRTPITVYRDVLINTPGELDRHITDITKI